MFPSDFLYNIIFVLAQLLQTTISVNTLGLLTPSSHCISSLPFANNFPKSFISHHIMYFVIQPTQFFLNILLIVPHCVSCVYCHISYIYSWLSVLIICASDYTSPLAHQNPCRLNPHISTLMHLSISDCNWSRTTISIGKKYYHVL